MSKKVLTEAVYQYAASSRTPISKKLSGELVSTVFETLKTSLKEEGACNVKGVGTFRVRSVPARTMRYELVESDGRRRARLLSRGSTGGIVKNIPERKVVRFSSSRVLNSEIGQ